MSTHAYSLWILREGREPVGDPVHLPLRGVLQRGVEALHWRRFLSGDGAIAGPLQAVPRWSGRGQPVVDAIVLEAGSQSLAMPVNRLFAGTAKRESNRLVQDGLLENGTTYGFVVVARPSTAAIDDPPVFELDDYPVHGQCPAATGPLHDPEFLSPDDFPVTLAPAVVADALALAAREENAETGGVLFGRLLRQTPDGRPLLAVTYLCPAANGHGDGMSFTFTPETWSHAQVALTARAADEIMVGSFHSHPDFCRECTPEQQKTCAMRRPFFSDDDVRLHESVFPAAYSVGLLASHDGTGFVPSLWGWRDGFIQRRSYQTTA